ncbi:hypothetical protein BGW41_001824 [Actinomortierella wolfii]|nr:hypothetical protein BGW41_001824 [Actinomortierella wolfii]
MPIGGMVTNHHHHYHHGDDLPESEIGQGLLLHGNIPARVGTMTASGRRRVDAVEAQAQKQAEGPAPGSSSSPSASIQEQIYQPITTSPQQQPSFSFSDSRHRRSSHHRHGKSRSSGGGSHRHKRRKRSRSRSRSRSLSSDSSLSETDYSSSDSDDSRRRHRRHRHRSRSRSRSRSRKSSKRHRSDKKKDKKDRKKHKKSKKESVNKASKEYGTYGILTPADMWNKESEFQAWLMEVKNLNPETIPQNKMKEHFVGFMEDYNTVTMPHEKYYDLEKWETRQRAIRMGEPIPESQQGKVNLWNDQEQLRMQQRDKRRANASSTPMYVTTSMLEEMRRSQHERVETDRLRRMGFDTTRKGGRH